MRRKRTILMAIVASLLIVSGLVFSGCWGRVVGPTGGHQILVIKPKISDRIIFHCAQTGHDMGGCAAGVVRALCYEVPLSETNPISDAYCLSITWTDHYQDIEDAIDQVVQPGYDCLAATMGDQSVGWGDWFAIRRGVYGCAD